MSPQIHLDSYAQTCHNTIHILGTGAIGCYIATTLKSHHHNVSLLLRTQSSLMEFRNMGNSISYNHVSQAPRMISGFQASAVDESADTSPISSLIVCTKSTDTLQAIKPIASRITSQTNILLLQNGYGVVEELIENLWQKRAPPTLFVAANRHCVVREKAFHVCRHSGPMDDAIRIGQYPIQGQPRAHECFLIQAFTQIPELHAAMLPWPQLLSKLYKKLIVNACVNAMAGLLVCSNGKIVMNKNKYGPSVMELILQEAYQVLGNEIIGETYDSMLQAITDILHQTKDFTCSTVQDFSAKRITEIDYINGYICKLGHERNIDVRVNQTLVQLVHFKELLYD